MWFNLTVSKIPRVTPPVSWNFQNNSTVTDDLDSEFNTLSILHVFKFNDDFISQTSFLKTVGGHSITDNLKRITKSLFKDQILVGLTWGGTHQKDRLENKVVASVILVALKHSFPNATSSSMKSFYGVYLRNAKARIASSKFHFPSLLMLSNNNVISIFFSRDSQEVTVVSSSRWVKQSALQHHCYHSVCVSHHQHFFCVCFYIET